MARLTAQKWDEARAEYEVRGISMREVARLFGVAESAVRKKAKNDGWIQGKSARLVDRKVAAVKALAEINEESAQLPRTLRYTVDKVAKERLQAEGLMASLDVAICSRAIEFAKVAKTPDELETLSRTRRNIAPQQPREGTTVNVQQANCVQAPQSPREALAELVRDAGSEE